MLAANPELLDKNLLDRYYSLDLLKSAAAREHWIEPDRRSIP
jgi:hypothetical protein